MPYELFNAYFNLPLFMMVFSRLSGMIMFQPLLGALSRCRRMCAHSSLLPWPC
jgi:hypothetical protein